MAKIGIIISSLYACGGEERVVSIMANEWVKLHDVTIYTFENRESEGNNRNDYYLSDKIKVERVSNTGNNLFCKVIKLLYYRTGLTEGPLSHKLLKKAFYPKALQEEWVNRINEGEFDIVVGISGSYTMLLGYIKDRIRAKAISWEHSSYEGYFDPKKGYYRNRKDLYCQCAKKLDACVVLNEDIRYKYRENLNVEALAIYNPKSFSSEEKADLNQKCFVTCGRVEAEKGYDDLITAFYHFNEKIKGWKLLIVGGGSLHERLEEQAKELGIETLVTITGYIHNVSERLLQGSIFMMTSRWEGFPMTVTEALEMGLPIISYDLPAMYPLVTDGVEGRIVPAFENEKLVSAMEQLATSVEERMKMSKAAIKKADSLSPEHIVQKWFELFEKLEKGSL